MAKRTIEWESKGADKAAKDAKDVAKSQDSVDASAGKLAKTVGLLSIAYAGLKELLVDSVHAYADVDAIQGQIRRNMDQMGMSASEANAELERQNKLFRENAKYGVGIKEQHAAYRDLLDVTKDVTKASEDHALAVDIQADKDIELAGAAKLVAEARIGKVTGLERLGVLTKDQVKDLTALKDGNERAAVAMAVLRDEFGGAAEANRGLADTLASNEVHYERIQIAMGKVVAEFGDEGAGLIGRTLDFVSASEDGTFTVDNFATAFENFADTIPTATENIGHFFDALRADDIPDLIAGAGIATEGGRETIRRIAGRGRARAAREAQSGGGGGDGGGGSSDSGADAPAFVGPELTPEARIRIAQEKARAEEEAARAKEQAARRAAAAQREADAEEHRLWERQMARLAQARREREAEARAAEEAARKKAAAAELAAEREAAAAERRREQIARADARMRAEQQARLQEQRAAEEAATQATIDNAEMAATGAANFAASVTESVQAQNAIKGGTHLAEAAGAIARGVTTSDPRQFIGAGLHIAAATKYFAQAGGAGGGGVASKGASASAAGASSAAPPAVSSSTRRDVDLANSGGGESGGGTSLILSYSSIWPPTAQQVKDTARLITGSERGEL